MRTTPENLLMSAGRMHTTNQRTILERIQEMNDLLSSFMTNQATPHLGALSSLINSETSNHRRKPRIGAAFTVEWRLAHERASTWKEQRRLWIANKGTPMTMEYQRGGGENLYFKSGKDAFMSSNLKALHTYFYSL